MGREVQAGQKERATRTGYDRKTRLAEIWTTDHKPTNAIEADRAYSAEQIKMIANAEAIEIRVCIRDRLRNSDILVGTTNIEEARRIARIWGEKAEGEPVTRNIFRRTVVPHDGETLTVEGITVWPPLF